MKLHEMPLAITTFPSLDCDRAEDRRLAALARIDGLDSPREPAFERISRLIRNAFGVEVGLVSLIDAHRQWYKSCIGLPHDEVPLSDTFCRRVIVSGDRLVVEDASQDVRFRDNPHVKAPGGVRFYASECLKSKDGENIGTICAIGFKPRRWSDRDTEVLKDLAALAAEQFELRLLASTDGLTGTASRKSFMDEAERAAALAVRHGHDLSCIVFDLDHFKSINDRFGHAAGDIALSTAADACRKQLRQADLIGRIGGEEFAVLLPHTLLPVAAQVAEKLKAAIEAATISIDGRAVPITASFGIARLDRRNSDAQALVAAADRAMYISKAEGRNRCTVEKSETSLTMRRVLKAGIILFNNRSSTVDCTVRALGSASAGIDVTSSLGVPDRFKLRIKSDATEFDCRVVARTDKHIEVDFC